MKPKDDHIWALITRVLSGEASSAEQKEFQQWLKEDPKNQLFFEELEACWKEEPHEDAVNPAFLFDYERGLGRLQNRIRKEKQQQRAQALHDSVNKNRFSGWKMAASIMLLLAAVSVAVVLFVWKPSVASYATSAMEQRIITLPDGSTARLNKNSSISFRKGFSGSKRRVTLQGEAFFKIKHNDAKPFIIHAGDAVIRDIGTSFDVKEEQDGRVVVAIKEGKAALQNGEGSKAVKTVLLKNQIGVLHENMILTLNQTSVRNYLSWINGQIVFKNMPFYDVTRQLDDIYGIHCQLADSSLSDLRLTAYIKDTSLHDVLHMIALSLDIKYQKQGKKVIWMQQGTKFNQRKLKN